MHDAATKRRASIAATLLLILNPRNAKQVELLKRSCQHFLTKRP
jgi:hypothetical protein